MPALQIRDFPEDAYQKLCARAKENGRSISQEHKRILLSVLEGGASQEPATVAPLVAPREAQAVEERIAARKALFERIESRPPIEVPAEFDTVKLVREMRDEG